MTQVPMAISGSGRCSGAQKEGGQLPPLWSGPLLPAMPAGRGCSGGQGGQVADVQRHVVTSRLGHGHGGFEACGIHSGALGAGAEIFRSGQPRHTGSSGGCGLNAQQQLAGIALSDGQRCGHLDADHAGTIGAQGRVGTPVAAVKQQQVALGDLLSGDAAAALEGHPASAG